MSVRHWWEAGPETACGISVETEGLLCAPTETERETAVTCFDCLVVAFPSRALKRLHAESQSLVAEVARLQGALVERGFDPRPLSIPDGERSVFETFALCRTPTSGEITNADDLHALIYMGRALFSVIDRLEGKS